MFTIGFVSIVIADQKIINFFVQILVVVKMCFGTVHFICFALLRGGALLSLLLFVFVTDGLVFQLELDQSNFKLAY